MQFGLLGRRDVTKTLLMSIALAILITACGSFSWDRRAPPSEATDGDSTLDSVLVDRVVRVGIRNDFPPIGYIDPVGDWIGLDVDLAHEIAGRLGVELEMVAVNETTRITFLETGRVDMVVAGMNHTRSREGAVDFTQSYFWGEQTFLVRRGEFGSLESLYGATVAMNKGSSAIDGWRRWVVRRGGELGAIIEFSDKQLALQALKSGVVDGYGEDNIPLLALAAGDPDLVLVPGGFNAVRYGIGVPEDDSDWRDALNLILQDMFIDGAFHVIYNRWLGPDTLAPLPLGENAPEVWP